jgi:hypothetical protein
VNLLRCTRKYGEKNGVKDIDKMNEKELIEHAHMLMGLLKEETKNE